jgi:hypothetical protein
VRSRRNIGEPPLSPVIEDLGSRRWGDTFPVLHTATERNRFPR